MSDTLRLVEDLIARPSVTPADHGCQELIAQRLTALGFVAEHLPFGPEDFRVQNLWAVHDGGRPGPTVVFAGHTDVVPPGPLALWNSDPFVPSHREGKLFGRGAADMKTSVAAMVVAAEEFVRAHPAHAGRVAFLITSDEEGPSVDGTVKVVQALRERGDEASQSEHTPEPAAGLASGFALADFDLVHQHLEGESGHHNGQRLRHRERAR